jgi:hypothetical protein
MSVTAGGRSLSCFAGTVRRLSRRNRTDSSKSDISFQSCMIQGQNGVTKWMSEHPIYRADAYYLKTYYLKTSQTV